MFFNDKNDTGKNDSDKVKTVQWLINELSQRVKDGLDPATPLVMQIEKRGDTCTGFCYCTEVKVKQSAGELFNKKKHTVQMWNKQCDPGYSKGANALALCWW